MTHHIPRLWVPQSLATGTVLVIDDAGRAHHLRDVMRMKAGDATYPFNADDGEFAATVTSITKRALTLEIGAQRGTVAADSKNIHLIFAPLKRANTELVIEKAVELGAARLTPVLTDHTQTRMLNTERLTAIMIDAVEQCGGFTLPALDAPVTLQNFLHHWPHNKTLYAALETERDRSPAFAPVADDVAILIGPEGGWSDDEITLMKNHPAVKPISLGTRILRAETAAIVALGIARVRLDK